MIKPILAFVSSLALAYAGSPLATVANDGPFALNEQTISARGVQSWPLLTGDRIVTAATPALISFHDGSTISLSANSALRLSGSEAAPVAVLESGALDYNIAKGSKLAVTKSSSSEVAHQASAPHLINHATVDAVVAASLAGVGMMASRMEGSVGGAASASASVSPLLAKPPPLSHFQ